MLQERLERQIGSACLGMGLLTEASDHLRHVLTLAKQPIPTSPRQRVIPFATELARQARNRIFGARHVPLDQQARLLEIARAYEQITSVYYWDNQRYAAIYTGLAALNRAEQVAPSRDRARLYGSLAIAGGLIPQHSLARAYARLALQTAERLNDDTAILGTLRNTLTYAAGAGDFAQVERETPHAKEIGYRNRDYRSLGDCIAHARHSAWYQSKTAASADLEDELYTVAQRADNVQLKIWAFTCKADHALYRAETDDAMRFLAQATRLYDTLVGQPQRLHYQSVYARLYLHQGDHRMALQMVDKITDQFARSAPTVYTAIYAQSALPETLLTLLETRPEASEEQRNTWKKQLAFGMRNLSGYARVFPIGQPRMRLWRGLSDWLERKPDQAAQNWQKAIHAANKLNMPHDAGLAHYEWGRHLKAGDPARTEHLNAALDIFTRIDAVYDANRTRAALKTS